MRYLALFLLTGCQWDALTRTPEPVAVHPCTMSAYTTRRVTVTSGDSTWTTTDTLWLGSVVVDCPKAP